MSAQKDLTSLVREFRETVELAATRKEHAEWLERAGRTDEAGDFRFYARQALDKANRLEDEILTWVEA
jgi:hypothetical protein